MYIYICINCKKVYYNFQFFKNFTRATNEFIFTSNWYVTEATFDAHATETRLTTLVGKLVNAQTKWKFSKGFIRKYASKTKTTADEEKKILSYSVAIVMQQAKYISRNGENNQMYRCAYKLIDLLSTTLMNMLSAHDIWLMR